MAITYTVDREGHFIHAIAEGILTSKEFVDYELAHAIDERIRSPVFELLEIRLGACKHITMDDMANVLKRRIEVGRPHTPHRCAIVVYPGDVHAWNLAKFYEGMAMLHSPETVIVFGDDRIARIWLGVGDT